jgi:hypothetical protein
MSLVLDLSLYAHEEKIAYVEELMTTLIGLRERRGKPHWFLIDEAHYFCRDGESLIAKMWSERMSGGGFALLSYRPEEIAPTILKNLDHLMITHLNDDHQGQMILNMINERAFKPVGEDHLQSLTDRQVYFFMKEGIDQCHLKQGIVEIESTRRQVPHIRHLHKYLRAPLPVNKQFHFNSRQSDRAIPNASSMYDFMRILPDVPPDVLDYHLRRGDFEAWVKSTLHDEDLARRIHKIANRHLEKNQINQALFDAVSSRYAELESLI